jgi:hypothetical protein
LENGVAFIPRQKPVPKKEQISITPPKPHSPKQQMIMASFMMPGITEVFVSCGTKFGKSLAGASGIVNGAINRPQSIWRWVAPIYEQSKVGFEYVRRILPPEPIIEINNSKLEINLPDIDTLIKFFHAQNPTSLEGHGIAGYVFDEAAKTKEDAYAAAKTTRTVTRGPMLFLSTPFGKNWFYRKCLEAKEEMIRARHEGRTPTKIFIRARTADNPFVPRESIEEARRELPTRLFRQYYEAEFIDDGAVFTGYRDCMEGAIIDLFGEHQAWFADDAKEKEVVIGADWAKVKDWTVFFAIAHRGGRKRVVGFERFHGKSYPEAIRSLMRFSRKFKSVDVVYHDKTGVGMAIDDHLAYTDLPFHGVTFTNPIKSEMVNRLMTAFEQVDIVIPRWNVLQSELETFEVKVNPLGNMSYNAADGSHDDTVCALMLAHQAALQYGEREMAVRYLEDLPGLKDEDLTPSSVADYYKAIADDDDDF